jgi:LacI family transcriptional regulator
MKLRTTLADIARQAGVGKTTVSLALRNHPKIPEATRRLIREVAEKLDYRPDPALARIAAHRWRTRSTNSGSVVAYITTNHPSAGLNDVDVLQGARTEAEAYGYKLEHFRYEDYRDPAHLGGVIFNRGIRGVMVGQLMREDFAPRFPWHLFSCVACNTGYHKPPVHLVMPDHAHAVKRAFDEARRRGYERIGLVLFDEVKAIDDFDKVSAYLYCQSFLPKGAARLPVAHINPGNHAIFKDWLAKNQPDCVLGINGAIYWWLQEFGRKVPGEIGFVSLMGHCDGKVTGLDHHGDNLGRIAFEQLETQMRNNVSGIPVRPAILMVESEWVEGETLPVRTPTPVPQASPVGLRAAEADLRTVPGRRAAGRRLAAVAGR